MTTGWVFDIQRMCVHDGPGIRTTVFFKGCPLHCLWCHNPESQSLRPVLALYETQCIGCGDCLKACPQGNHSFVEGTHQIRRDHCSQCGLCVQQCTGALALIGREMSVEEVMQEVERDRSFYHTSGGGMTLSGGEPLMQPDFAAALLQAARQVGIHTAIETSGYGSFEAMQQLMPMVDLWLYDVKETNEERHRTYTGVGREKTLSNLRKLDEQGRQIILRCPIIPGLNDREDHFAALAGLANELQHVQAIHIEPYNRLGEGKCRSIGWETFPLGQVQTPDKEQVALWVASVQQDTPIPVFRS